MIWSAQTGEEEPLTSPLPERKSVYDWSPDGTSILTTERQQKEMVREAGKVAVWRVPISAAPNAELHERKIISDPAYALYQAHDSPDGQWLVFEAGKGSHDGHLRTELSSLYVIRAAGGPWIPIVNDEHWADKPRWSPDGKIIYFLWGRGSFFNVWGIHFNPKSGKPVGEPFRVTDLDSPDLIIPGQLGRLEISLTLKDLVVTHGQVSGGIWVLDNVDR
jgi:Tol biopolymer transport system component